MLQPRRKSWRLQSVLALLAGIALLSFEIRRIQIGDDEAWFWLIVAGLIVLLSIFGIFRVGESEDEEPRL